MIDVFGQMWGTMVLNSAAMIFAVIGLLALCAKDLSVIALVGSMSVACAAHSALPPILAETVFFVFHGLWAIIV